MTRPELELNSYVHHLEEHLKLTVFGPGVADPEAAVLLVRGALAAGDRARAVELAAATTRLTAHWPDDQDMAAAAAHVQGLVQQDPAALEAAGQRYSTPLGRAWAAEDAGMALAQRGDQAAAVPRLHDAYDRYRQLGRHRRHGPRPGPVAGDRCPAATRPPVPRPAFGWGSLTETEQRIAHLVASGLTNRQIASKMFLSSHTVAFHLRRIFCKLDVVSRVQLASMAADKARTADKVGTADSTARAGHPRDSSRIAAREARPGRLADRDPGHRRHRADRAGTAARRPARRRRPRVTCCPSTPGRSRPGSST